MYNFVQGKKLEDKSLPIKEDNNNTNETSTKDSNTDDSTRCFVGNLPLKIDEDTIRNVFKEYGKIVSIEWLTDKQTGKFYGSSFVTFETSQQAHDAHANCGILNINGRKLKINIAPKKIISNNPNSNTTQHRKMPPPPKLQDKPENCNTIFIGNLPFDITEQIITDFFARCGSIHVRIYNIFFIYYLLFLHIYLLHNTQEIRFLYRPDGTFKGCGFVEFDDSLSVDKAIKLHAKLLAKRPVRIDFA